MDKHKKLASVVVVGLGSIFLLAGCSVFLSPDEDRYQFINQVKYDMDYKDSGKVTKEYYDNNNGFSAPSYFYAEIEGPETFDTLSSRLVGLKGSNCDAVSDEQTRCSIGQVDVIVSRLDTGSASSVVFKITDTNSGREIK